MFENWLWAHTAFLHRHSHWVDLISCGWMYWDLLCCLPKKVITHSSQHPSEMSALTAYVAGDLTGRLLGLSLGESISQLKRIFPLSWLHQSLAEAFLRTLSEQILLFDWAIKHMHLGRRNMVWPRQALLFHLAHCLCARISISHYMDLNLTDTAQSSLEASLSYIKQTVNRPYCGLLTHLVKKRMKRCFAERASKVSFHVSASLCFSLG